MGNRAVITTAPYSVNNVGIYVHWNGGRESIEGFMLACRELGYRSPAADPTYAMARLTQAIGVFFGGTLSLGIGINRDLDTDNGNNGVYLIGGDWEVVGREDDERDAEQSRSIADTIIAKVKATEE